METFNEFFACRIVLAADHRYPENIQRLFRLESCFSRRSSIPRNYSLTFSAGELSQPQIINNMETLKDFFACRIVLAADHRYPEIIQRFFACRIVLAADHRYPENIQRLFRLESFLSRRSSIPRNYSLTFSPGELSQPQIINNMETLKDFFACRIVLAADHRYPENIQRLFRLQNCLSRRSSIPRKHSKTFSPAELSQPQIIDTPKIFIDFFTWRIVLAANHQQYGNIERIFACKIVLSVNHQYPIIIQRLFRLQICLSRRSSIPRKYANSFSPADMPWPQIITIPKTFKDFSLAGKSQSQIINNMETFNDFFAFRIVLAADHR